MSMPQLMATVGICAGYFTCYASVNLGSSLAWRLPFVIMGTFSVFLATGCFFLPISPRWFFARNRREEAMAALVRMDILRTEVEKDITRPRQAEQQGAPPVAKGVWHLLDKQYTLRTMLGFFILGMMQLCGIDGIVYVRDFFFGIMFLEVALNFPLEAHYCRQYAPVLFPQASLSSAEASFLASGVSGSLAFAISIHAFYFVNSWSRRACSITGGVGLSGCMYIIGSLYASNSVHSTGPARWVVIVSIFAFAVIYAATWAILGKIYASEIQPIETRASGNSVAQGLTFVSLTSRSRTILEHKLMI